MISINYNDKKFVSVQNSESGEVTSETVFHYHQKDDLKADENRKLEMRYQHLNKAI